jgi:hypothetical protein
MKPHKWAKEIKAWADGAEIECKFADPEEEDEWKLNDDPIWLDESFEFRIKPQPKEPQYLYVYGCENSTMANIRTEPIDNHKYPLGKIKLEVDDEAH